MRVQRFESNRRVTGILFLETLSKTLSETLSNFQSGTRPEVTGDVEVERCKTET